MVYPKNTEEIIMTWATILGMFQGSVPFGVVAILIYLARLGVTIHYMKKSIDEIQTNLSNHITDTTKEIKETNKQIADLKVEMYKKFGEIQVSLEKLSKS